MGPPRRGPLHHRPARSIRSQEQRCQSQANRGPKNGAGQDGAGNGGDEVAQEPGGGLVMQFRLANFEVRSTATSTYNLPQAVRTSAVSMWKQPIG